MPAEHVVTAPPSPYDRIAFLSTPKQKVDPIPPSWNTQSDKEFDVPSTGTNTADFDIKSA